MSARLTGHVVLEIDGDEQQIEAEAFEEEHEGLWKYYGDGYTLLVTADLEAAVDDEGNYPTFLEEPEVDGSLTIEVIDSELAAARGDHFDIDDEAEEDEGDDEDPEET